MRCVYELDQYILQKRAFFYMNCVALYEFWIMLTYLLEELIWNSMLSTLTDFGVMFSDWIVSN